MKTIFKNCIVIFKKLLPSGTEVEINLDRYNSLTGIGTGYYLDSSGKAIFNEGYMKRYTYITTPVSTEGYSKVVIKNISNGAYHYLISFTDNNSKAVKAVRINVEGVDQYDIIERFVVDIPPTATMVKFGSCTDGAGIDHAPNYTALFVV